MKVAVDNIKVNVWLHSNKTLFTRTVGQIWTMDHCLPTPDIEHEAFFQKIPSFALEADAPPAF